MAPTAVAGMKRTINDFVRGELDLMAATQRNNRSQRSRDLQEGLAAFPRKARAGVHRGVDQRRRRPVSSPVLVS